MEDLDRQAKARKDMVVHTTNMELKPDEQYGLVLETSVGKEKLALPMTKGALSQLSTDIGINQRSRLYYRLRHGTPDLRERDREARKRENGDSKFDSTRYYDLWCEIVNDILRTEKRKRLLRGMANADGEMYWRAYLSDGYQIIPNDLIFYEVAEAMKNAGAEIWHARLNDNSFHMYAVSPGIHGQVNHDSVFDPGDGWLSRWYGDEGDVLNAALTARNSETGHGGCELAPAILRRVCANYCVWQNTYSRRHIGARHDTDVLLTEETLQKRNEALFSEIRDIAGGVFDPERFVKLLEQMQEAADDTIKDPVEAAEALQVSYQISDARRDAIRKRLIETRDNSRYGLIDAVTYQAHSGEDVDHEEGFALERLGADLTNVTVDKLMTAWAKDKEEKKKKEAATAEAAAV
jgi:hypothetical protein